MKDVVREALAEVRGAVELLYPLGADPLGYPPAEKAYKKLVRADFLLSGVLGEERYEQLSLFGWNDG